MQVKLTKDTITPELKRLMGEVKRPVVVFQAGAKAVQVGISKHLKALQGRGNAKGWAPRHFFAGRPDSVERNVGINKVTDKGAEITIADPRFVHRIIGGRVTAKRARMLAIPLTEEAYALSGKGSLREAAPGLKVVVLRKGIYLVRESEERVKGKKQKRIRAMPLFKLVRSVTHSAHPNEMPDTVKLGSDAGAAMDKAARLLMRAK